MSRLQLSTEELTETLERARQIAAQRADLQDEEGNLHPYLEAAQELGLPREAILQALRERMLIPGESLHVGDMVFAPSADGCAYAATVERLEESTARVSFLSGGEHEVSVSALRPVSLVPGRQVEGDSKELGWRTAWVERYNPKTGRVTLNFDNWYPVREAVSLRRVRLPGVHQTSRASKESTRGPTSVALVLLGIVCAVAGFLIARLFPWLVPF